MSGKYYVAKLMQFHNIESKQAYLAQEDSIHISTKMVNELLKPYETKEIYCMSCNGYHKWETKKCK